MLTADFLARNRLSFDCREVAVRKQFRYADPQLEGSSIRSGSVCSRTKDDRIRLE